MIADLTHLPPSKQAELERIVACLHKEFADKQVTVTSTRKREGKIEKIILFGSHARGDWVDDKISGYRSDYDILIIVSHKDLTDFVTYWYDANDRILRDPNITTVTNLIIHTKQEINAALKKGQYFFTDIVRDGQPLYERRPASPTYFAAPVPPTPKEAYEWAKEYYDGRIALAYELASRAYTDVSWKDLAALKISIFLLHQATENAYNALLLTHTLYSPPSHNIEFLRSQCERLDPNLIPAWPRYYQRDRRKFQLLKRAYVEARYSMKYKITKEELDWLTERVAELLELVKMSCEGKLGALEGES